MTRGITKRISDLEKAIRPTKRVYTVLDDKDHPGMYLFEGCWLNMDEIQDRVAPGSIIVIFDLPVPHEQKKNDSSGRT